MGRPCQRGVEEPEPVLKDHMEAMEDQLRMVYAGPEYFAERRRQAQQADECAGPEDAEETVRKNDAATEKTKVYPLPLYAGPAYIEDNPLTAFGGPKDLTDRRRQAAERATEADRKADGKA